MKKPAPQYIYVAVEQHSRRQKVGISVHPAERVEQLQTGNPEKLTLSHVFDAPFGYDSESEAHEILAKWHIRGEWFTPDAPMSLLYQLSTKEFRRDAFEISQQPLALWK